MSELHWHIRQTKSEKDIAIMDIIFMGTPHFATSPLRKLLEAGHRVTAVITQPDRPVGRHQVLTPPPVKLLALAHGLPVYQPEKIKTAEARELFEPMLRGVDAAIVAAYGRILPVWMLEAPRLGCINIHSSLLPKYRGAAPINWAIASGETETGVTIMQMDAGMDTGAILRQAEMTIGENETADELTPRLAELGAALLIDTLPKFAQGEIAPRPQNEAEATYAPLLKREDGLIDWKMTARQIADRRRGFHPFPGCYTFLRSHRLEILEAKAGVTQELPASDWPPGTIVEAGKESFSVLCGQRTCLNVTSVQPAGKRAMTVRDFLNGARLHVGERLGD